MPPAIASHVDKFENYLKVENRSLKMSLLCWIRDLIPQVSHFFKFFFQDEAIQDAITTAKNKIIAERLNQ